jgi:hypothetical protein
MRNKYYTPDGMHPEDAIFKVKQFINELTKIQESYFNKLSKDLKLNKDGDDFLFDYIHNSGDDGDKLEFCEYLDKFKKEYKDIVSVK